MKNKVKIGTTLVGLIIGGTAYWFQPYNQLTILGIHIWLIMGVGTFLGSIGLMLYLNQKPLKTAMQVCLGVGLAVITRIVYDVTLWDSTTHNLAPFEIIITAIITIPSAITGGYLGLLIKKIITSNKN